MINRAAAPGNSLGQVRKRGVASQEGDDSRGPSAACSGWRTRTSELICVSDPDPPCFAPPTHLALGTDRAIPPPAAVDLRGGPGPAAAGVVPLPPPAVRPL